MNSSYDQFRLKLATRGLWPTSKMGRVAWYVLALDLFLFVLQKVFALFKSSFGDSLGGWVGFLSFVAIVLFAILAFRWLKVRMLWRLRNRLIVTYVFIGVIPVVLLVALALGSFYLFAGQFATFIVTSGLNSELRSLEAANFAIAHQFASQLQRGQESSTAAFESLRHSEKIWADRQVTVWVDKKLLVNVPPIGQTFPPPSLPPYLKSSFSEVTRDQDQLYLRAVAIVPVNGKTLVVVSSNAFDQTLLEDLAANLGEVTLYASGLSLEKVDQSQAQNGVHVSGSDKPQSTTITFNKPEGQYVLNTGNGPLKPTLTAGTVPPPTSRSDQQVTFPTTVSVVDWNTSDRMSPAGISVQTRFSKLYERLFGALGDFAPAIEYFLLLMAVVFGIIELTALFIGTRLTRTVTGAVAQIYDATQHVNRGDFSHRIPVKSTDQVAALATSFNSMTASLEKLIEEQKEKQRLENELVIAQEVQAQLFPREISQLASLEVHGFCRPARTVSGDYYDFLAVNPDKLILAVGDISGKGISAALLMATIHSAVRAYSLQDIPALREPVAVGAVSGSGGMSASSPLTFDVSPGALLALLNHQLYESTPAEKYATLFLGMYNGADHKLTYSNGGHLPPIILSEDGSIHRLDRGGTVVGLFNQVSYEEGSIQLRRGDILLAYSDGVTEPENDFGEFGEQRLIDLVRENRDSPLARISEIVTAAVDDWIGANEQPDDVTLVLARAR
ncbi:MAG TPA: SpoIIE family protein phosphatase [Terriglobales bacterium]|nr:SpoIIE family protein phosphatase [Terriglobales bacterium]